MNESFNERLKKIDVVEKEMKFKQEEIDGLK
jgi:hypothetical protein